MNNFDFLLKLADKIEREGLPEELFDKAYNANEWFDRDHIKSSLNSIVDSMLRQEKLQQFTDRYNFKDNSTDKPTTKVALVLAGNIPFVGCADVIYCALCQVDTYIKYASKDSITMRWFVNLLSSCSPKWRVYEYNGEQVDKIIATGSDNSNRYFKYNFDNIPSIMRGSRASMAIITGRESDSELLALWDDIFLYYGQGCRNVSLLLIPTGYDLNHIWHIWRDRRIDNIHFNNIYKQQSALLTMQKQPFYDGGYFTMIYKDSLLSNTSQINVSEYGDILSVKNFIKKNSDLLQCVVGTDDGYIPFGRTQMPELWDYADNKDVVSFLLDEVM